MVTAPNEKRMASDKNQEIYHRLHDRTNGYLSFFASFSSWQNYGALILDIKRLYNRLCFAFNLCVYSLYQLRTADIWILYN